MLVGLAEEARHETSLGDSILRRVYGFEAQKSYQVDSSFGKTFARKDLSQSQLTDFFARKDFNLKGFRHPSCR